MTAQQKQVEAALRQALLVFDLMAPRTHKVIFIAIPTQHAGTAESQFVSDLGDCLHQAGPILRTVANTIDP